MVSTSDARETGEVSARIEHHPDFDDVRVKVDKAFEALFEGREIGCMPEFAAWEERHYLKQGIVNERLYLQGMKDGLLWHYSTAKER